jgi:predicted phage-related endonuclease
MLTPEQLAARRLGLGSSDIAAVAGIDKYRNAIHVFNEKVLPVEQVEGPATGRNPARWGHRLEGLVIEEWAELKGVRCLIRAPGTIYHPKNKLFFATPDALALPGSFAGRSHSLEEIIEGAEGLCEAKAPGLRMADDWSDDEAPESYLLQTQWQIGVIRQMPADLCALIGGQDFRMRAVEPDPETFGMLTEIGEKFWRDHVMTQRPPPLDHSEAAAEYIRRRFPKPKAGMLVLPDDHPTMLHARVLEAEIRTMKSCKEEAEKAEDSARNRLKELVGDAQGIEGICTFKEVSRAGYEVKPVTYRELRLALKKKEKKS